MKRDAKQIGHCRGTVAPASLILLLALLLLITLPCRSLAGMRLMTDGELTGVTAQGFSSFTMVDGVARADFAGISGSTYTEIDSLKMGYWDKGDGSGKGWDQNWRQVKLGTPDNDLNFNGFFFQAVFDPATVNDPAHRKLLSLSLGSRDVTGLLSADFQSLTAVVGGTELARGSQGVQTYRFDHTELSLNIDASGPRKGIWINMGNATKM